MSSPPPPSVRQRGAQAPKKRPTIPAVDGVTDSESEVLGKTKKEIKKAAGSEWDYKVALAVITVLAFITRFYGISHPNQVVFDEVHFGKVRNIQHFCWGRFECRLFELRVVMKPTLTGVYN